MYELTHRTITLYRLTYYWVQPGDAVHEDRQRIDSFGYFPTSELADLHAEATNLGHKLSLEQIKPPCALPSVFGGPRRVRYEEGHKPLPRLLLGFYVAPTEGFTSDDGKTIEISGQKIEVEKSIINYKIENNHPSMEYRHFIDSLRSAP